MRSEKNVVPVRADDNAGRRAGASLWKALATSLSKRADGVAAIIRNHASLHVSGLGCAALFLGPVLMVNPTIYPDGHQTCQGFFSEPVPYIRHVLTRR